MPADKFNPLKDALGEFTNDFFIDYERESIYIQIPLRYADEIFKIINSNINNNNEKIDIVFVREFKPGILTIVAAYSEIILFDIDSQELGGDNN